MRDLSSARVPSDASSSGDGDGDATSSGFTAFVEGLRGARCCRLTYSDLLEATDAVRVFAA